MLVCTIVGRKLSRSLDSSCVTHEQRRKTPHWCILQDRVFDIRDCLVHVFLLWQKQSRCSYHVVLIQARMHFCGARTGVACNRTRHNSLDSTAHAFKQSSECWNLEDASEFRDRSGTQRTYIHLFCNLIMSSRPSAKLHLDKFLFFPILYTSLVTAINEFSCGWIWPSLQVQSVIFSYHRQGWWWHTKHLNTGWTTTPNIYKCGLYLSPWLKTKAMSAHTDYLEEGVVGLKVEEARSGLTQGTTKYRLNCRIYRDPNSFSTWWLVHIDTLQQVCITC